MEFHVIRYRYYKPVGLQGWLFHAMYASEFKANVEKSALEHILDASNRPDRAVELVKWYLPCEGSADGSNCMMECDCKHEYETVKGTLCSSTMKSA